jgi:hypothetical protein
MFADTGVKLPPGVGTKTPEQVAAAVLTGIDKNRTEIDVAPIAVRATGKLAGLAPGGVTAFNRKLGGRKVAENMEEAQRHQR